MSVDGVPSVCTAASPKSSPPPDVARFSLTRGCGLAWRQAGAQAAEPQGVHAAVAARLAQLELASAAPERRGAAKARRRVLRDVQGLVADAARPANERLAELQRKFERQVACLAWVLWLGLGMVQGLPTSAWRSCSVSSSGRLPALARKSAVFVRRSLPQLLLLTLWDALAVLGGSA